jgi:3-dehydroquinate synthase
MIKHGLIHSQKHLDNLLKYDPLKIGEPVMKELIGNSIRIKEHFVERDPFENNIRKVLNFGHTIGHALESYMFEHGDLLHGEAVALGMICELYLSRELLKFPGKTEKETCNYILKYYPEIELPEQDYSRIVDFMKQDKKNQNEEINFTLLRNVEDPVINQDVAEEEVIKSLHYYNALIGMI